MATNKPVKRDRVSPSIINMGAAFDPLLQIADERSEDAVIGSVLQQPDLFPALSEILQPADFFFLLKGYIWHACDILTGQGKGLDILTISTQMEELQAPMNGDELIRELARMIECAPDLRNAEQYARKVFDASLRLRLLAAKEDIAKLAVDKTVSVDSLVDQCDHLLYKATNRQAENRSDAKTIMSKYFERVETMVTNGAVNGLSTGFAALDELTGGVFKTEVAVLAGAEGMGKTTWALSKVRNVVKAGKRAAVFSLEMTQEEIIRIFTSMETGIYKSVLKQFSLTDYQYGLFTRAAGDISRWPLEVIDDYPTLNPIQLRRKLRTLTQRSDLDLVVIDGLWLMEASEPSKNDRPRDVFTIMRDLNIIARDFDIPVLITHQYNAEINKAKYPTIYHLSESAGVRRNAQVVWGLYRPSYYDRESVDDATKLYILKDRNGINTGTELPFIYNKEYSRYEGGQYANINLRSE